MRGKRFTVIGTAIATGCTPLILAGCVVPSPSPGGAASLLSVAAISSTDAYAGGGFNDSTGQHDFMEHWNGQSWQEVFLPAPFGTGITAITAVNANDVWAISDRRTLHYDGSSWRSLANPAGGAIDNVASAPDGSVYGYRDNGNGTESLFVMATNGWRVASPVIPPGSSCEAGIGLTDLAVVKANDVWAIGNGNSCTALLHWTGTRWQQSPPISATGIPQLEGISAVSDTNVWAVGGRRTAVGTPKEHYNSLIVRWNGAHLATVPTVDTSGFGFLTDVDATPGGVWAVGTSVRAGLVSDMLIKKLTGAQMVDQPVQRLPIGTSATDRSGWLGGVSVVDGVVTSVGFFVPSEARRATLTDRRNAN